MENPSSQAPQEKKSLKNKRLDQWVQETMADITPGEMVASAVFMKYFRYTYEYAESLNDDFSVSELQFAHRTAVHDVYKSLPQEIRQAYEEYAHKLEEEDAREQAAQEDAPPENKTGRGSGC